LNKNKTIHQLADNALAKADPLFCPPARFFTVKPIILFGLKALPYLSRETDIND
jgi:hypothetical protein